MTASSGGELKIKYYVDDGTMVEIVGNSLSNDNEVRTGINLINYYIARSVAPNATINEIVGQKLEKDKSENRWEYRFQIWSDKNWVVRISARS